MDITSAYQLELLTSRPKNRWNVWADEKECLISRYCTGRPEAKIPGICCEKGS
jgi:hypothetical protein